MVHSGKKTWKPATQPLYAGYQKNLQNSAARLADFTRKIAATMLHLPLSDLKIRMGFK
jgi:hypothetical protein